MTHTTGWEKRFDERWTLASFTWNGDSGMGEKFAQQTLNNMKRFFRKEIEKAREEGAAAERERILIQIKKWGKDWGSGASEKLFNEVIDSLTPTNTV